MSELIAHLLGDYCLQNHWMANKKKSSWFAASVHVEVYMIPFVLWFWPSALAFAVMAVTHLLIDRFRLARYWVSFWGIGNIGYVCRWLSVDSEDDDLRAAPEWLSVWLLIIVDNTFHLAINHFALSML